LIGRRRIIEVNRRHRNLGRHAILNAIRHPSSTAC
jgi:hypothetical protein